MNKITLNKKKTITLKRTSTQRSDSSGSEPMRVCLYVCESSRPIIIYYRLCMLAPDSS